MVDRGLAMTERSLEHLRRIFREAPDKHVAHDRAAPVLAEMSADPQVIGAALRAHLERGPGLAAGHYPVISLLLESNPWFDLVVNCWLPLPDADTDLTTKAIHHHGSMLLSTATAFGPGYEHWTFSAPELLDPERSLFSMEAIESGIHGPNHVAFVDRGIAHVPFYVPTLTITLALWSTSSPTTWRDHVKRSRFARRRSAQLRRAAAKLGLTQALDLKIVEYFDFHPGPDGFVGMRERREFPLGPNGDYVQSLLHVVQATGNEDLLDGIESLASRQVMEHPSGFAEHLEAVRRGDLVPSRLSDGHYGVPQANFRRGDIEAALQRLKARR